MTATLGQREEDFPQFLEKEHISRRQVVDRYKLYTEKPTYILWIVSSWLIAALNFIFVLLSIRDMWNNGYSAGTHWLSSAVIVATMFGLMLIHEYIIRKKKNDN